MKTKDFLSGMMFAFFDWVQAARLCRVCVPGTILVAAWSAAGQQDFSNVEIKTIHVASIIYMLQGAGGNIGVSVGADGILIVDDQFAPLAEKIEAALTQLNPGKLKFVLNTHWHFDHTGGNENLGKAGAIIVAHENVRKRMSTEQMIEFMNMKTKPDPKIALPVITFSSDLTFHINGDEVRKILEMAV